MSVNNYELAETVLTIVMLVIGYLYILRAVMKRSCTGSGPVIAAVLFLFYGFIGWFMLSKCIETDYIGAMFLTVLAVIISATLGFFLRFLVTNIHIINKGMLALFVMYTAAVLYVTLMSRTEPHDVGVNMRLFSLLRASLSGQDTEPAYHVLLNVVLFVPLTFLFTGMRNKKTGLFVAAASAAFSASIESIQLIMRKGVCDIDDLCANTIGALIGLAAANLIVKKKGD